MDIMLKLQENIEYQNFFKLLDLCFKVSTYFSFTQSPLEKYEKSINHANFLKKLEPFLVKTIKTTHWHSYYVIEENKKTIYVYKSDIEAKKLIESTFDNLFLGERVNGEITSLKDLPEDLCFFVSNKLLLGTVSHEYICTAYPYSNEIYEALLRLGEWEVVKYSDKEQIILDL